MGCHHKTYLRCQVQNASAYLLVKTGRLRLCSEVPVIALVEASTKVVAIICLSRGSTVLDAVVSLCKEIGHCSWGRDEKTL